MKKKQQYITDCGGIQPVRISEHAATTTHTPKEENKMKKQGNNLTELVFILDRSGSMHGLEADTIGGFNSMLEKQKRLEGEALVTTVLFDDEVELLHDRLPLSRVKPLTREDYTVRGCTALLDTVGDTVSRIGTVHKYARAEDRPAHTVFVITTDGMENASRRYTAEQVRSMIKRQQERYGWEFIFLGANIDAVHTAAGLGIRADRAANYHADAKGTALNFETVACAMSDVRMGRGIGAKWKERIDADFAARKSER